MSKLSEWVAEATENRLFTAAVTAAALTGAIYVNSGETTANLQNDPVIAAYEQSVNMRKDLVEGEFATLNENYWHLSDMLEEGDVNGAIELAASMKQHIQDVKENLNIVAPYNLEVAGLDNSDAANLNLLQEIYNNLEVALKTDNVGLFSDVVAQINEVTKNGGEEEEYAAASLGNGL